MTVEVVVPELGESVVEATVANWLKQEGDRVKANEPIVSLETDKVDLDVPAGHTGVLRKIQRQVGEDVEVGQVLALIEEEAGDSEPAGDTQAEAAGPADEQAEPAEVEPEEVQAQAGEEAREPVGGSRDGQEDKASEVERATPVARRMAAEKGVDLSSVAGGGPGGRVTKKDVQSFLEQERAPEKPAESPARAEQAQPVAPSEGDGRPEERVRMSRRRRTIAERLVSAQQTAAILTTFNEVDMTAVIEMRQRKRDDFKERHKVGLGFMSFFVKATIGALRAFPQLNASIEGNEIVLKKYYDIGIAVGAEEGLVVPVIRDADRMSFAEIEQSIVDLVEKTRDGSLSIEDLRGGTFTISNGGVFGSLLSTPILNPPQVGILGLHKIEPRAVVVDGEVVVRSMMYVALSYDHRIVDGREAVQFLVKLKELIEDPEELLLAG